MDGFVCSPLELAAVREIAGVGRLLVTPGVRSAGAEVGDQKRVAAPGKALADGASYLVIGRQITRASDPRKAAEALLQEISTG
jgi:orotidine-5'-phosphate decarboxylase